MKKVRLQGFPYDAQSSFLKGCDLGPQQIRNSFHSNSSNYYAENGIEVNPEFIDDKGDFALKSYFDIETITLQHLADEVPLISFGGDHSITYPILCAFLKKYGPFNIIHLDAHADLYREFEGNKYSHACTFTRIMEKSADFNLFQIGVRTLNREQREVRDQYDVTTVGIEDWTSLNAQLKAAPTYISLDIDVLDPAYAPGVSHYEPGGLTTREVIRFIQNLNTQIIGADIVEYNPSRDYNNITGMVCAKLFKELVAKMLS